MSSPVTAASQITAVTVYPDRARVTRQARVTLAAGAQSVDFNELPLALQPDSVRAAGQGAARARLLGVTTRMMYYPDTPAEAVRELETQWLDAQTAGQELTARYTVLEREQQHLDDLGAQAEMWARGLALRGQQLEEQGAAFDFLRARSFEVQHELLRLAAEKRENDKRVEQLGRRLQELRNARPRQRYTAAVELDVTAAGELTLELTYVVGGASWTPLYDFRLGPQTLEVTYLAQVQQQTGEAWAGVALALSTAQPALTLTVPELSPWYLRPAPPPMPLQMQAATRGAMGGAKGMPFSVPGAPAPAPAAAAFDEAPEPQVLALETATAQVSESGAALTYRLAGGADVPGDGTPRKVTVAVFPLKPVLDYVTAPKLAAACYRRAKIKNESAYTLLAGRAQLFEGEEYLGALDLELTPPNREVELFLGADERVSVERELTARDVDKTLLGDRRRTRYGYKLTLENLREMPVTMLVRDQLPVAADEQIKVRLESADPRPAEQSDLNLLEWKLTLPAGAKQTVRFEFTVEHPRALTVLGMA